jgi:hypothetical protein
MAGVFCACRAVTAITNTDLAAETIPIIRNNMPFVVEPGNSGGLGYNSHRKDSLSGETGTTA